MVFVGSNVDLRNCLKIEPRIKRYCAQIKNNDMSTVNIEVEQIKLYRLNLFSIIL